MIRSLYYSLGKPIRTDISPDEFPRLLRDRKGLLWVDFMSEPEEIAEPILEALDIVVAFLGDLAAGDGPFFSPSGGTGGGAGGATAGGAFGNACGGLGG